MSKKKIKELTDSDYGSLALSEKLSKKMQSIGFDNDYICFDEAFLFLRKNFKIGIYIEPSYHGKTYTVVIYQDFDGLHYETDFTSFEKAQKWGLKESIKLAKQL